MSAQNAAKAASKATGRGESAAASNDSDGDEAEEDIDMDEDEKQGPAKETPAMFALQWGTCLVTLNDKAWGKASKKAVEQTKKSGDAQLLADRIRLAELQRARSLSYQLGCLLGIELVSGRLDALWPFITTLRGLPHCTVLKSPPSNQTATKC